MAEQPQTAPLPSDVVAALRLVSTATLTTQLMARGLRNTFLAGAFPTWAVPNRSDDE